MSRRKLPGFILLLLLSLCFSGRVVAQEVSVPVNVFTEELMRQLASEGYDWNELIRGSMLAAEVR